ncbi:hypothetical protein EC604_22420 [Paenibacillus amylolyticus]|uniref:Uncharacterized protein n=1 Tax=Paenibacillus amylolyticus TaxID=1451 RepID=A0A5M9WY26_PAEAM|nr:hypothetical protein [Paenibacillus amylolyticus]KAA8786587.1 hypothetical protein EC604_22420 [Paenibacillus amylolyticus]
MEELTFHEWFQIQSALESRIRQYENVAKNIDKDNEPGYYEYLISSLEQTRSALEKISNI